LGQQWNPIAENSTAMCFPNLANFISLFGGGEVMPRRHSYLWFFLLSALFAAVVYWRNADWWVYVGTGPERWAKFIMPWWWQIGESAVVGMLAAAPLVGFERLVVWVWSRLSPFGK
jgi:hypothetical protein